MICKQCGAKIDDHAAECPFCGVVYEENSAAPKPEASETEIVEETAAEGGSDEVLGADDSKDDIDEILDENEIKRRRQMEKMRAEKQAQLDEIEKRRKTKKRRQARNKALIALAAIVVIGGMGCGGYMLWKRGAEEPDVVIQTQQPTDDNPPDAITPPPAPSETAERQDAANGGESGGSRGGSESSGGSQSGSSSGGSNWKPTGGTATASQSKPAAAPSESKAAGSASSSPASVPLRDSRVSSPSFGGKSYSSDGGFKDGKFTSALVTGTGVTERDGKKYMTFSYNGAAYLAKVSSDTTAEFVTGRPMTITAFKTSETLDGTDVYEITRVTNYTGKYVFPNSGFELLGDAELADKTANELYIGRNEIFARHGRKFKNEDLREYFSGCSWYKIKDSYNYDNEAENLNSIEQANVNLILKYEAKLKK